jgi:hypothetical protein
MKCLLWENATGNTNYSQPELSVPIAGKENAITDVS